MLRFIALALVSSAWLGHCAGGRAKELRVDFAAGKGTIRPLHGVNGGPLNYGETVDLSAGWRELAVRLTRLHDCEWPNAALVDMHAVFPSLAADPESPASYQFARTDDFLRPIVESGAGVVYRLGESIEHTRRKYHVAPPADYEKWSAACVGVIRHYNEGWADGFRYNIRYWEIWNEPENRPAMWTGSDEDYFRLYATASKAIKARFPDLLVGGPSAGATGNVADDRLQPTEFLQGFVRHCHANDLALDFFSWHTYSDDPSVYARKARAIRRWLDEQGFRRTEIHLNEWNYLPGNDWGPLLVAGQGPGRQRWYERMGGPEGAAFVACVLVELQDSPVDAANFYSGDSSPFGLFTRDGVPKKTFQAMRAFKMLLDTPQRVTASGGEPGKTAVCAGLNKERTEATVLVSNYRAKDEQFELAVEHLPWRGATDWKVFRLDAKHDLDLFESRRSIGSVARAVCALPAPGVLVFKLSAASDAEELEPK